MPKCWWKQLLKSLGYLLGQQVVLATDTIILEDDGDSDDEEKQGEDADGDGRLFGLYPFLCSQLSLQQLSSSSI